MSMSIEKVAIIGSGVMGSGIAAQITNAGHNVVLLDIVPDGAKDRNVVAKGAVAKMLKTDPAPLMHKRNAKKITVGNIEDNLDMIADCDWVIEVVLENLDVKKGLYEKIEEHRKQGCIISSNTSSIPLNLLIEGRSEDFQEHFMITHFFNPPRYMRLLELVTGDKTDAGAVQLIRDFCDIKLGKGVVDCHDTPGFIANRIGAFWLQSGVNEAFDLGLTVEEADAVMSRPVGIPKTGVFGLIDLVGVDLMPHLAKSLLSTLPRDDFYVKIHKDFDLIDGMIADGYTGRKGKGGFYRLNRADGKKVKESIDLKTGDYAPSVKPKLDAIKVSKDGGLKALMEFDDKVGQYAWRVLAQTLSYAASLVPEIADNIYAVDRAMKLGYNWKFGPFELIDQLGTDWFADHLAAAGMDVPDLLNTARGKTFYQVEKGQLNYLTTEGDYTAVSRETGVLLLEDVKRKSKPVKKNGSAKLWDIGDGVLCLEFTSKMNSLDDQIMKMIHTAIEVIGDGSGDYKSLVVYNEGTNFSVGANLGLALFVVNVGLWPAIEGLVRDGQNAYKALKFAPFPVVVAPSGMALGGGCEILLHADAVQAHAETYAGLIEVGVGIIPGWGGCKEMLVRHNKNPKFGGVMPPVASAFEQIGLAKVAKSADEARAMKILQDGDQITMNRDRLLADAKQKALGLSDGYEAPEPQEVRLPGITGKLALMMMVQGLKLSGKATKHDVVVSEELCRVLSGGDKADITRTLTEDDLLDLEFESFMRLIKHPDTIARIEHMLEVGKPLRN